MNSKRILPFPLSTLAAWPPQPPSSPFAIRAPLSPFEESSSTASTSSGSEAEIDDDDDDNGDDVLNLSGSGSDTEPAPVLVRSESMPVARLTGDEDFDVEEEGDVSDDSDGFVVRVPVINDGGGGANPDPRSDEDDAGNADLVESLDAVRVLGENSAKGFFDGEEFSDVGRVSSKGGELSSKPIPSIDGNECGVGNDGKLDLEKNADEIRVLSENLNRDVSDGFDGDENLAELAALGMYDCVIANSNQNQNLEDEGGSVPVDYGKSDGSSCNFDDSDGFVVRVPVINEDGGGDANPNPNSDVGDNGNVDLEESLDGVGVLGENSAKDFFDGEEFSDVGGVSSKGGELSSNPSPHFDGAECGVGADGKLDSKKKAGEMRVLSENLNGDVVDGFDGNVLSNVYRVSSDDGNTSSEPKSSPSSDNGGHENLSELGAFGGDPNVVDFSMNSDGIEENFKHKEMQMGAADTGKHDGVIANSNQNQKLEDEDCSVPVDYGKSDGSSCNFEEGGDGKLSEGLNGVSSSLVESFDNRGAVIETQSSVEDEVAVTRLEHDSIVSPNVTPFNQPDDKMTKEDKNLHERVESIRVKFLRIVHRLGHSPDVNMATLVLHHLAHIEGLKDWKSCFQNARKKAVELETEEKDKLDFSCNFLVIGKAGVGKSATINSIFEEEKSLANPFQTETTSVRKIEGVIDGIKIQILDTPGLGASLLDQASNRKILSSVKKHMKRCPPDVVLYVDRLDIHTRDFNDLPLLRSITRILGLSIWSKAVIALTHATEDPPEGPGGSSLSYEAFVAQRSHVVLQSLRKATGDMGLTNPVALVENHPSCRWRRNGQKVLPNGSIWRSELLLLCYSSKILSEAFSIPRARQSSVRKLLPSSFRSPPMQFFLPSLLESKEHPKLPLGRGGNEHSGIDLEDFSDDEDEEDEYDQLPPFSPLSRSQIAELSIEHRRAYFAEYDYRLKLLQKKQLKELIRGLKEIKKRVKNNISKESDDGPTVAVTPAPDMVLPPSFDCDNPAYRYRSLEPTSRFVTGFLLNEHGWDHDSGFDGVRLENLLAIASRFPAEVSLRLRKDKNDFTVNFDSSISAEHGQNGSSLASFNVHSVGDLLSYCLRGETRFKNSKKNMTTVGFSANRLGDTWAAGLKLEDRVSIGKRVNLTVKTGAVRSEGDVAYGTNLEATLMKTDYLVGLALATFGLSLFRCDGYLICGGTLQTELEVGRSSKMAILVGLNSNKNGQITIRTSSCEQLQMALLGLVPIVLSFLRRIWSGESS